MNLFQISKFSSLSFHTSNSYSTQCRQSIKWFYTAAVILVSFMASENTCAKTLYRPKIFNEMPEITAARSRESENFVVYWGEKLGTDPKSAPDPTLRFDPDAFLADAETVYQKYVVEENFFNNNLGIVDNTKFIIMINDSWNGKRESEALTGWAFGGQYDDTIGTFRVHPRATKDMGATVHEFIHAIQSQSIINSPHFGLKDFEPSGFFWESHANYARMSFFPKKLFIDWGRYLNMTHFHFSSTRKHYANVLFLQYMGDLYGRNINHRVFAEARKDEHPLEVYKRLLGWSQDQLNEHFARSAMKHVTMDFSNRKELRQFFREDYPSKFQARRFALLEPMAQPNSYKIPHYFAPQDYGFNTIKLKPDSKSAQINMEFYGHLNEPAGGSGYRFAFVATDGTNPRYGDLHYVRGGQPIKVNFAMQPNETELYLVVSASQNQHHNYPWEIGFPKIYRYPWQIQITGAKPFTNNHTDRDGAPHPNGGGWVDSTAHVDPSVYLAPGTSVLGGSRVEGNARLLDYASAVDAKVYDAATLSQGVLVIASTVKGNAELYESAIQLSGVSDGDYRGGGDSEVEGITCSKGFYRQSAHPNNGRTHCDGLTTHPANDDINPSFPDYVFGAQPPVPQIQTVPAAPATSQQTAVGKIVNLALSPDVSVSTSHVSPWENLDAIKDGKAPTNSADNAQGAYGNWGQNNQWHWVEFRWNTPKKINSLDVYWWADGGGIVPPKQAYVEYWDGSRWIKLSNVGTQLNRWNTIDAGARTTQAVRIHMISDIATGILEAQIFGQQTTANAPLTAPDSKVASQPKPPIPEALPQPKPPASRRPTRLPAVSAPKRSQRLNAQARTNPQAPAPINRPKRIINLAKLAQVSTSHVSPWETLGAVNDGIMPANSSDNTQGAYGNWGPNNQWHWVEFRWDTPKTLNSLDVYWWADGGGIVQPKEAYAEYWNGTGWQKLSNIGTTLNRWNSIDAGRKQSTAVRIRMISDIATGILETQIFGTN